jgi:hypothetical protein
MIPSMRCPTGDPHVPLGKGQHNLPNIVPTREAVQRCLRLLNRERAANEDLDLALSISSAILARNVSKTQGRYSNAQSLFLPFSSQKETCLSASATATERRTTRPARRRRARPRRTPRPTLAGRNITRELLELRQRLNRAGARTGAAGSRPHRARSAMSR